MHSFIRSFVYSFLPSFIHSFIPSFVPSFVPSFLQSFIPSFIHSFSPSFLPSFLHSFIHAFIHSFRVSFRVIPFGCIHPFIHCSSSFHFIPCNFKSFIFNSFVSFQLTESYKQSVSYSHVLFSKFPPRPVPGTTWYLIFWIFSFVILMVLYFSMWICIIHILHIYHILYNV